MTAISIDELPEKLKRQAQRYLKRNGGGAVNASHLRFTLSGVSWGVVDESGRFGSGSTPTAALRNYDKNRLLKHPAPTRFLKPPIR